MGRGSDLIVDPLVAVIILNWNGLEDTLACLNSLGKLTFPPHEIIIVDNGSSDGSIEELKITYPDVTYIENSENLGFTGGNNAGLRYAKSIDADYALLLNNDTEVDPAFLGLLVDVAESDEEIGIIGPSIFLFDEPEVLWSAGGDIDWMRGRTYMVGINQTDTGQFGEDPREVDFVSGCALMIRMAVVEEVGLLDTRFFVYYEETEWCVRVARCGYKIMHVPLAKIWHKISIEDQIFSPIVTYYMIRNRLLFLKLSHANMIAWIYSLVLDNLRTLLSLSIRPKWKHKRARRSVMLKAMLDFFSGKFGRAPNIEVTRSKSKNIVIS